MFLTFILFALPLGGFTVALTLVLRFVFGTLCFVNACGDDDYFCNYFEMEKGDSYFDGFTPTISETLSEIRKAS